MSCVLSGRHQLLDLHSSHCSSSLDRAQDEGEMFGMGLSVCACISKSCHDFLFVITKMATTRVTSNGKLGRVSPPLEGQTTHQ